MCEAAIAIFSYLLSGDECKAVIKTLESKSPAITPSNGQYKTSVDWGDSRACADLESYMNGFGDPRIYQYFKNTEEYGRRSVVGCRAGANVTNKDLAMKKYSAANIEEDSRGMWKNCVMTS